jgi:hypothetical protein
MGKRILTKKYCADFMGAKNCAWLNKEGDALKESRHSGDIYGKSQPAKSSEGIADQALILRKLPPSLPMLKLLNRKSSRN